MTKNRCEINDIFKSNTDDFHLNLRFRYGFLSLINENNLNFYKIYMDKNINNKKWYKIKFKYTELIKCIFYYLLKKIKTKIEIKKFIHCINNFLGVI